MKTQYTWSKHKYIRKEGNKYIYPDDLKANTSKRTVASKVTSNSSPGVYVKTPSNTSTNKSKLKNIVNSIKNTASNVSSTVKKTVNKATTTASNTITKAVNHNKAVKAAGGKDAYDAKQVEAKLKASTQQQQRERARQEAAKKKQEEGRRTNEIYNKQQAKKKLLDEARKSNAKELPKDANKDKRTSIADSSGKKPTASNTSVSTKPESDPSAVANKLSKYKDDPRIASLDVTNNIKNGGMAGLLDSLFKSTGLSGKYDVEPNGGDGDLTDDTIFETLRLRISQKDLDNLVDGGAKFLTSYAKIATNSIADTIGFASDLAADEGLTITEYYDKYSRWNPDADDLYKFNNQICETLSYFSNTPNGLMGNISMLTQFLGELGVKSTADYEESMAVLSGTLNNVTNFIKTGKLPSDRIKHGGNMIKGNYIMHRSDAGGVGGTGKHRYVAKIGNRYIYPEDLKNGARIVGNKIVRGAKTAAGVAAIGGLAAVGAAAAGAGAGAVGAYYAGKKVSKWAKNTASNASAWAKKAKAQVTGSNLYNNAKNAVNNAASNAKNAASELSNKAGNAYDKVVRGKSRSEYTSSKNKLNKKSISDYLAKVEGYTEEEKKYVLREIDDIAREEGYSSRDEYVRDRLKNRKKHYTEALSAKNKKARAQAMKEEARKNNKNSKLTGVNGMTNFEAGQSTKKTESSKPHSRDKKTTSANATVKRGKKVDTKRRKVGIK